MIDYKKPTNDKELSDLKWHMSHLENQITGEMTDEQFMLRTDINHIKKLIADYNNQLMNRPEDSSFECFGCGS